MDKQDKKRRAGQDAAFYAALAVCLIAIGVGTWQLLQPEGAAPDAQSGTAAVSSAALLPDAAPAPTEADASAVMGPDAAPSESGGESAPQTATDEASATAANVKSAEASGAKDAGNSANAGASSNAKSGAGSKDTGSTKSGASSKDTGDAKSGAGSKDTGSTKSGAASNAKSAKDAGDTKNAGSSGGSKSTKSESVRPVEGKTVTAYSMDKLLYNETMRDWRTHDGIDIAADAGTAVVAAKAGTVESVAADPVMGMTVTVRHEGKWETVYSCLTDAPEAEAGDEVSAGQVIGYVGETAASEAALGPHLHFAVLNDGAPSDPEAFLS